MSVRVCYVRRDQRGAALRGLRLVGPTSDEAWPDGQLLGAADLGAYAEGAAWAKDRLSQVRGATSITMLVLDVTGGVCSWLSSPGADASVVAALARIGGGAADVASPMSYFAPTEMDSTVQPLGGADAGPGARRLAVLGLTDVPGRLLTDALDRSGVPIEDASTLWHAMCVAWDPAARSSAGRTMRGEVVAQSAPVSAVVLVEPEGRLVWCWSREGRLLVAGSSRLRVARPVTAGGSDEAPAEAGEPEVQFGAEDVSRLAAEWLGWAAQVGAAPSRIVCVVPEAGSGPAVLGEGLGRAWPGASVDVAVHEDPIGATLRRLAEALEATPAARAEPDPGASLLLLSARPGRWTRRLYLWAASGIAALALVVGLAAWQLSNGAERSRLAKDGWTKQWQDAIKSVYPDGLKVRPGMSSYQLLSDEVTRRERELLPPEKVERAKPVLQEVETVSHVLANPDYSVESIRIDSATKPQIIVLCKTVQDAEAMRDALRAVAGSYVDWTMPTTPSEERQGDKTVIKVRYQGDWVVPKTKAGG